MIYDFIIYDLGRDLKVRILSYTCLFHRGRKVPPRGLVVTKRGGKDKGTVIPSGNITCGPIKHI